MAAKHAVAVADERGRWTDKLTDAEAAVLRALHQAYPAGLTREELAIAAGVSLNSVRVHLHRIRQKAAASGRPLEWPVRSHCYTIAPAVGLLAIGEPAIERAFA